jgi:fluoroquinolone resistance protein
MEAKRRIFELNQVSILLFFTQKSKKTRKSLPGLVAFLFFSFSLKDRIYPHTMPAYHYDQTFENHIIATDPLPQAEYEQCTFVNCDWTGADLRHVKWMACRFVDCNLSLANIEHAAFQDVHFERCKMLGLRFDRCNGFGLSLGFERCVLNDCSFFRLVLKKTAFIHCSLIHADFAEANLTEAVFDDCNLDGAIFDQTNLQKADLRTAYHWVVDPEQNQIRQARFEAENLAGLLTKYDLKLSTK